MPYTLIDSIKDEIKLLTEMENWAKDNNKTIIEAVYSATKQSLNHIVDRVEGGYVFSLEKDSNGKAFIANKKSDRKTLEEEYPALKKAAEQYDIIKNLIDSTPDN